MKLFRYRVHFNFELLADYDKYPALALSESVGVGSVSVEVLAESSVLAKAIAEGIVKDSFRAYANGVIEKLSV